MEKGGDDAKSGDNAWILQWFYKRIRSSGIASREGEGKTLSVKSAHKVGSKGAREQWELWQEQELLNPERIAIELKLWRQNQIPPKTALLLEPQE